MTIFFRSAQNVMDVSFFVVLAIVRQVGNVGVNQKSLGRAGSKCWLGKHPVVGGVVMNPVDNPMGAVKGKLPLVEKKPQPLGVFTE